MRIATATLCDAANVREGLLNVLSAGITHVWRPDFPALFGVTLAMQIEAEPAAAGHPHRLEVFLRRDGSDDVYLRAEVQFDLGVPADDPTVDAGIPIVVPLVVPMTDARLPGVGLYRVSVDLDGIAAISLAVLVTTPRTSA